MIWLLAALLMGAGWLLTFGLIDEDRARALSTTDNELVNLGRLSQEHAERTISSVEQTLRIVLSEIRDHPQKVDLQEMTEEGIFDTQILHQIAIIDVHGMLTQSSLPFSGRINLSDREHFKVHLPPAKDELFISRPVLGRTSGKWSVQLSRRITLKNGRFGGVVVASLDPSYFTRFYSELKLGQQGVSALFRMDGQVLALRLGEQLRFEGDLSTSPALARLVQGDKTSMVTYPSLTDGIDRTHHFRKLPSYPLVIGIGMASKDILAAHAQKKSQLLWQMIMASGLLLLLAATASRGVAAGRRHSAAQKQSEELLVILSAAVEQSPVSIVIANLQGQIRYVNPKFEHDTGYTRAEVIGQNPLFLSSHEKSVDEYRQLWAALMVGQVWEGEFHNRRKDGSLFWERAVMSPIMDDQGVPLHYLAIKENITDRKLAETQLRIAATAFESQEGMCITDAAGIILRVNQAYSKITGYSVAETLGKTTRMLNSGRHDADFYAAMWAAIQHSGSWQGEIWNRRKNGDIFPEWLSITAVKDEADTVTHYVSTLTDITHRKQAEAEIQHLAFYDPLTSLPNRRLLTDRLKHLLAANLRRQRNGALLFIDLDNFKNLNDTQGHDQGDLLLKQVAERLNQCVRKGDTVARLGGDEFVVMLQELSDSLPEAASEAEAVGQKILATLRQPYPFSHLTHYSSASLGVALISDPGDSVDELLKRADLALYQAKDAGRNTLRFYDPDMQAAMNERAQLEADLRLGLQEKQFLLYYQPQVDALGHLMGVEALVRWQHPQRGMVSPAHFIPLAEDTGLILPLGQWVLETACHQLKAWAGQPHASHLTIAVNVSALQFYGKNFVADVLATLDRTGAPATQLKLELTESLLVSHVEDIIAKMVALKAMGVGFSLDDFGTGYSSLTYLKRLPLDQLKIDQSFLHEALTHPKDAAIVSAIVAMGHSLGMMVIAEGVETQAQRDFLEDEGCYNYQGYFFGRPAPVAALDRFFLKSD